MKTIVIAFLLFIVSHFIFGQCRLIYVTPTASGGNPGTKAFPKRIDEAFSTAFNGDVIRIANGTYNIHAALLLNSKSSIEIEGGFDSNNNWHKNSTPGLTTISRSTINPEGFMTSAVRLVALSISNWTVSWTFNFR